MHGGHCGGAACARVVVVEVRGHVVPHKVQQRVGHPGEGAQRVQRQAGEGAALQLARGQRLLQRRHRGGRGGRAEGAAGQDEGQQVEQQRLHAGQQVGQGAHRLVHRVHQRVCRAGVGVGVGGSGGGTGGSGDRLACDDQARTAQRQAGAQACASGGRERCMCSQPACRSIRRCCPGAALLIPPYPAPPPPPAHR